MKYSLYNDLDFCYTSGGSGRESLIEFFNKHPKYVAVVTYYSYGNVSFFRELIKRLSEQGIIIPKSEYYYNDNEGFYYFTKLAFDLMLLSMDKIDRHDYGKLAVYYNLKEDFQ